MSQCPKCGDCSIGGPEYCKNSHGKESLKYWCRKCGYSENQPTLDSKTFKDIFKELQTKDKPK